MTTPRLRPVQHQRVELEGSDKLLLTDPAGYASPIAVTIPAALLLSRFDGKSSVEEIATWTRTEHGVEVAEPVVAELASRLDELGFLDSPRFQSIRSEANAAYRARGARPPSFAGRSYPAGPAELRAFLDERFAPARQPATGRTPARPAPRGIVAPHVDLRVAGSLYADAYAPLLRCERPDAFVVFGTSHPPISVPFVASTVPYDTPLGTVPTDLELLSHLAASVSFDLYADEAVHAAEHSAEFQALHLRYLYGDDVPPVVTVLCASLEAFVGRGEDPAGHPAIASLLGALDGHIKKTGRRITAIAGADLAHLGPRFDDPGPIGERDLAELEMRDRETLALVARGDARGFHTDVVGDGNARRICGLAPIYLAMRAAGAAEAALTGYRQWAEDGSVVSFASLVIDG